MNYKGELITFRLGSRYWWLEFVPPKGIPANRENKKCNAVGQIVWHGRTIYIDRNISARTKTITFFHELTHEALGRVEARISKDAQEKICDAVGCVMTEFFYGNRNFELPFLPRDYERKAGHSPRRR